MKIETENAKKETENKVIFKVTDPSLKLPLGLKISWNTGPKKSQSVPWDSSPKLSQSLGFGFPRDICPSPKRPRESVPIPIPSPWICIPEHKSHGMPVPLLIPGFRYILSSKYREI